jgi:hypothetical protein
VNCGEVEEAAGGEACVTQRPGGRVVGERLKAAKGSYKAPLGGAAGELRGSAWGLLGVPSCGSAHEWNYRLGGTLGVRLGLPPV